MSQQFMAVMDDHSWKFYKGVGSAAVRYYWVEGEYAFQGTEITDIEHVMAVVERLNLTQVYRFPRKLIFGQVNA